MHSLLYISSSSTLLSNEVIFDILNVSRVNNLLLGITGLLLYHQGSFLQVIEGEKEAVHELFFNKISFDIRHKDIIKLLDDDIRERNFSDWSMGFKQISNQDWSKLEGYIDIGNIKKFSKVAECGNPEVITLIKSFADVNQLRI